MFHVLGGCVYLSTTLLALPSRRRRLNRRDWPIELLKDLFSDIILALGSIRLTCKQGCVRRVVLDCSAYITIQRVSSFCLFQPAACSSRPSDTCSYVYLQHHFIPSELLTCHHRGGLIAFLLVLPSSGSIAIRAAQAGSARDRTRATECRGI
jgi:hypothetical protein